MRCRALHRVLSFRENAACVTPRIEVPSLEAIEKPAHAALVRAAAASGSGGVEPAVDEGEKGALGEWTTYKLVAGLNLWHSPPMRDRDVDILVPTTRAKRTPWSTT